MFVINPIRNGFSLPLILLISFFLLSLISCGSGDSGSSDDSTTTTSDTQTGQFIDSVVEGLTYKSTSTSGTTNSSGEFSFVSGETVTFSIGSIEIGSAVGQKILTPVDFVANADETNSQVNNIATFLQSLDADNNLTNGISITKTMIDLVQSSDAINFNQSVTAFADSSQVQNFISNLTSASSAGARVLLSSTTSKNHLKQSIIDLYVGSYSGTYSGKTGNLEDSGTYSFSIATDGALTGTGNSVNIGDFTFSATIKTSGSFDFVIGAGSTSTNVGFNGSINRVTGSVSGTWKDAETGLEGTFTGSKK